MMALADVNPAYLSEEHIGFELAPRLNALGRLGDANLAVEFLATEDLAQARLIATQLEGLNSERKRQTDQVFQGALTLIERDPALLEHAALVMAHPAWPAGIIGIVASRLVEHFNRPVVLLATPPGELARGSARSVEGCNITAAIAQCEDLLAGYGGHPMAAGLSLDPERIPLFRRRLSRAVQGMLGEVGREPVVAIDGVLALEELTLDLVADLERLAPFGPGNPGLVLASTNLSLLSATPVGRNREHVLAMVEDQAGTVQPVIWWQGAGWPLPEGRFDLAYRVRASTYRGQRDVQVAWVDARPVAESEGKVVAAVEVLDYRGAAEPLAILHQLQAEDGLQVWREGEAGQEIAGTDRYDLRPAASLAVWTTPPGRSELQAAIAQVSPQRVVLFGRDPGPDSPADFLRRLAGLAKHTLATRQGRTSVPALAAATAQRETTVRVGLRWLAAKGHLRVEVEQGGLVQLAEGTGNLDQELDQIATQLKALLDETAAYRRYFARADAGTLA
jgi:single-stranded-DNA-specific exonuclease